MITEEQRKRYRENQKNFRLRLKTEQGQREYQAKKFANRMKNEYKGFKFACDGITTSIEVNLPFRCMETKWGQNSINEKEYYLIQKDLRNRLETVTKDFLAVVEPVYLQVVIKNINMLEEICNIIYNFGKEKTQKYGIYTKNGNLLKNYFE